MLNSTQVNIAAYSQCASCSEPPLGNGQDSADSDEDDEERKVVLAQPSGEEYSYFEVKQRKIVCC